MDWIESRGRNMSELDCSDKTAISELPKPVNNEQRGPVECRLNIYADPERNHVIIGNNWDDVNPDWTTDFRSLWKGGHSPVENYMGNIFAVSAKDSVSKIAICKKDTNAQASCDRTKSTTRILNPMYEGLGRKCFGAHIADAALQENYLYNLLNDNDQVIDLGSFSIQNHPPW
jgi:hypothetical protein